MSHTYTLQLETLVKMTDIQDLEKDRAQLNRFYNNALHRRKLAVE